MKFMKEYDLMEPGQAPTCMRVEFVRARHEDDEGSEKARFAE
jgi:hypothetical protein